MVQSFKTNNKNIAKYFFQEMQANIDVEGCRIADVEVWESDKSSMIYFE